MREGIRILNEAGIPTYTTPKQAVRAFMTLVAYSRNLESLYETPKDLPVQFPINRKKIRSQFDSIIASEGEVLLEGTSKMLLEAYGIPVASPHAARTEDETVKLAAQIGYPVILKILSPDITHKTDVGGVMLDLRDEKMVRAAFERIVTSAREKRPEARIEGVTVQPMIQAKDAVEMILGTKKDPVFGTVIMVGLGGTAAELFADRVLGFPPLNERLARRMLESLKVWPLLQGYRGRPAAQIDRLIETLSRLSYLATDFPELKELDINPLLVSPHDVIALDARILVDSELPGKAGKPIRVGSGSGNRGQATLSPITAECGCVFGPSVAAAASFLIAARGQPGICRYHRVGRSASLSEFLLRSHDPLLPP